MTPSFQGHTRPHKVAPDGGWKENTYYVCEVAFSSNNVIHNTLFYSGFLDSSGEPSGYNGFIHGSGCRDGNPTLHDAYYVIPRIELMDENMNVVNRRVET